jgi:DNA-binding LacI/PurR family transcriptional regulator
MQRAARKPPNLSDVARMAGVSRWVAGQVINGGRSNSRVSEEVAQRIRQAARELDYQPNRAARLLRGRRSHVFGLLVASAGDPLTSFLVQYLNHESVKLGRHTLICNTMGHGEVGERLFNYYIEEFAQLRVDGVFCLVHPWIPRDRQGLLARHPNTVFYESPNIPGSPYVTIDREAAIRLAVHHLIERGRKRIGLAVMSRSRPACLARRCGYALELAAHGLRVDERLIAFGEDYGIGYAKHNRVTRKWDFPVAQVDQVIEALIREQRSDAIVVHDDYWAAALVNRLRRHGIRVPDDVAIVGYLNHYLADWVDPPLTTIDPRHRVAARIMVHMLETMASGRTLPEDRCVVKIRPRLIVREST